MVEYGMPQIYAVKPNIDGFVTKQTLTVSAFANRVVTTSASMTVQDVGFPVVLHKTNEDKYAFGRVTSLTTIELNEDSKSYWITPTTSIQVMKGIGVASFESCNINIDESGIDYKGAYRYKKASDYTDADIKVSIENVVFTSDYISFINNFETANFGDGKAISVSDFSIGTDKEVNPSDIALIILKRTIDDDTKFEEFYIPRVNSGSLEMPSTRDAYMVMSYEFTASTKSMADGTALVYNI